MNGEWQEDGDFLLVTKQNKNERHNCTSERVYAAFEPLRKRACRACFKKKNKKQKIGLAIFVHNDERKIYFSSLLACGSLLFSA
jgi:hypothetical protein